jgi:hypothetical protein
MRKTPPAASDGCGVRETRWDTPLLAALLTTVGVAVGAGLFESRVVIPRWAGAASAKEVGAALESSGHLASGRVFWPLVGAPTVPLAVLNTYCAVRSSGRRRPWWLVFSATILSGCVATAGYFVPELHRLTRSHGASGQEVRRRIRRRVRLDNLRLVALAAAWLAGLRALSLRAGPPGWPTGRQPQR